MNSHSVKDMPAPLWTRTAFVDAIGASLLGVFVDDIRGISIDSRSLQKGDAFFAIVGEHLDGHNFAKNALEKGAAILVVDECHRDEMQLLAKQFDRPLLIVDDVLKALERLGCAARARTKAKIIAITGSVGKTTTKEALRHVLSRFGQVHANPASFNNHWGVPLTLARMPQDTDFGVFEIGMNHENEIRPLVKMVAPHIAIITCIGAAHLGYFSSMEAIGDAKAEIFEGLLPDGVALLNRDDDLYDYLVSKAHKNEIASIVTFGQNNKADYRLSAVKLHSDSSDITVATSHETLSATIGAAGRHIVQNILAVIAACDVLQLDLRSVAQSLSTLKAENGRGARYILHLSDHQTAMLIDESYNANPTSMQAALALLADSKPVTKGRRIAVLGDMLELGSFSKTAHENLLQPIKDAKVDVVFLVGTQMKALADKFTDERDSVANGKAAHIIWQQTVAQLQPLVLKQLQEGDIIMIKSSNSIGSAKIVQALLDHYGNNN